MTATTKFEKTYYGNIETPDAPNPRISAELSLTATTVYLTSGLLTNALAKPTDTTIFGIKNRDTGYTELCAVTAANVSDDGKTLSNVVRGLARDGDAGTDLTTSVAANKSKHPQDSEVRVIVAPQIFEMMADALQGAIASGGASWSIGKDEDEDITVYAANGDANSPFFRFSSATNQWVYSNDGVSSTPFGTGAGVTGGDGIDVTAGAISVDTTDTNTFVKTSSGAADENKVPVLNASGQVAKGFLPSSTDTDAATGTDDTKFTTVDKVVHLLGNLVNTVFTYFVSTRAAKTTPVDADEFLGMDSADSDKDKRFTLDQIAMAILERSITVVASDNLKLTLDTEDTTASTSYTKLKDVNIARAGTVRVTFEAKSGNGVASVSGRIYVNGAAVGTARSTTSSTYVEFDSEDITVAVDDNVQIYALTSNGAVNCYIKNMKFSWDRSLAAQDGDYTIVET